MSKSMSINYATVVLAIIFTQAFSLSTPTSSHAQWDDRSDELPGTMSTGDILLIVGGVAVATTAIVVLSKRSKAKKEKVLTDTTSTSISYLNYPHTRAAGAPGLLDVAETMPFNVFIGLRRMDIPVLERRPTVLNLSDQAVVIGFSLQL